MKNWLTVTAIALAALLLTGPGVAAPSVELLRAPNGGIQPQVMVDGKGVAHLVYFSGDAFHGNLFYAHSANGAAFSVPIRVNSQEGSAVAAGNIRGAHIAIGPGGRIHVAWNGSSIAEPKTSDGKAPMLYSRLNDDGIGFEPQRNLIQVASGIDGGGAIAVDRAGHVYVFWHAPRPGGKDEGDRRVWLARSDDSGKTFGREKIAFDEPTGACECCGMNASTDDQGFVYALFRSASEIVNRDMYLLVSRDQGRTFVGSDISKWKVGYCVMSSEAIAHTESGTFAAWETEKQVEFARIEGSGHILNVMSAPGVGSNRKHPALAVNGGGDILLAWTEGMGWKKGGSLAWQLFDPVGKPVRQRQTGQANGVPVWSLLAAFALPDGSFRILY